MIEYETLRQAAGSRYWLLVKEVKDVLEISWRAPLETVYGGPLRIVTERPLTGNIVATFTCESRLCVTQDGLYLIVTY
jgi:hypothetical protein